jgi:hypothetical protein
MSETQFLTIEDRFRSLPPNKNPFTVESIAAELGKTPEQAKQMIKAYQRQSDKALCNIEGNHVKDAELFDLKTRKLEEVGRYVILRESWKRNAKYVRASWGLYYQNAWKIHKLGTAIITSALNRYAAFGADVKPAIESTQKLLEAFKPPDSQG